MRRMLTILCALLYVSQLFGQSKTWINYTNTDYARKMTMEGDSILYLATWGGLVKYNMKDSSFRVFTSVDGLIGTDVVGVKVDRSRNVWIGTSENGIFKFDGTRWENYTTENTNGGVLDGTISCVEIDSNGNKWFGTSSGVNKYNDTSWNKYLNGKSIAAITAESPNSIWFGQILFDGKNWTDFSDIINATVSDVFIDRNMRKWFATVGASNGGVYMYYEGNWSHYNTSNSGISSDRVYGVTQDKMGMLWFATAGGISWFDGSNWQTFNTVSGLPVNWTVDLVFDEQQNLWVSTMGGGLVKYDGVHWNPIRHNELSDNDVQKMVIDKQGNKWFATWNGVSEFDGKTWRIFSKSDGLPSNQVSGIAVDSNGNVWISEYYGERTGAGNAAKFDGQKWASYPINAVLNCVDVDTKEDVWFGTTYFGAVRLSPDGQQTTFNSSNSNFKSFRDVVFDICTDDFGNVWFATWRGASKFDGANWTNYDSINSSFRDGFTLSIYNDHHGNLWFGTWGSGVVKFDSRNWTVMNTSNSGLSSDYVSSINCDSQGKYFFATPPNGVSCLDGEQWSYYKDTDGLVTDYVTDIDIDESGNVWFCSNSGQNPAVDYILLLPYAGSVPGGVSVLNRKGTVTVDSVPTIPTTFALEQNYPNPFNPTTIISYQLSAKSHVTLKVYDLLGREVATLVSEGKPAGAYAVTWNAARFASGMYIARLAAGNYAASQKLLLTK